MLHRKTHAMSTVSTMLIIFAYLLAFVASLSSGTAGRNQSTTLLCDSKENGGHNISVTRHPSMNRFGRATFCRNIGNINRTNDDSYFMVDDCLQLFSYLVTSPAALATTRTTSPSMIRIAVHAMARSGSQLLDTSPATLRYLCPIALMVALCKS